MKRKNKVFKMFINNIQTNTIGVSLELNWREVLTNDNTRHDMFELFSNLESTFKIKRHKFKHFIGMFYI